MPRLNRDLRILQNKAEAEHPRFDISPGWAAVDWAQTPYGGVMIYLRNLVLPPVCSVRLTDAKIEAPPNLYDSVGNSHYAFYRNIWIVPDLEIWDRNRRRWAPVPRLFRGSEDGFAFLCIHPGNVGEHDNILSFLRILDLHLLNPGFKAGVGESL